MRIDVWSDVVCPWCYVGKRNLETALATLDAEQRDAIDVVWRTFELDPHAARVYEGDYRTRLAKKYGTDVRGADAMIDRITTAGAEAGIVFRFDIARTGNTFDAHRLLHLALTHGLQDQLKERLMAAYFIEGAAIGERPTLARVARDVGLDAATVDALLESDLLAAEVRADEQEAHALGVSGVPFFVIDGAYGLGGAQPPEVLRNIIRRAWNERAATRHDHSGEDAPRCDDESCTA